MTSKQHRLHSRRRIVTQLGLASACAAFGPALSATQNAPATAAQEAIPQLLAAWAAAWTAHDPAGLAALYAPDATYQEIPTASSVRGREEIESFVEASLAAFANLHVTPRSGFQAEKWAVLEGVFAATSAAGRPISVPFAAVFELEGELIRRSADYFDLNAVLEQSGAVPEPEADASPAA